MPGVCCSSCPGALETLIGVMIGLHRLFVGDLRVPSGHVTGEQLDAAHRLCLGRPIALRFGSSESSIAIVSQKSKVMASIMLSFQFFVSDSLWLPRLLETKN